MDITEIHCDYINKEKDDLIISSNNEKHTIKHIYVGNSQIDKKSPFYYKKFSIISTSGYKCYYPINPLIKDYKFTNYPLNINSYIIGFDYTYNGILFCYLDNKKHIIPKAFTIIYESAYFLYNNQSYEFKPFNWIINFKNKIYKFK